MTFTEELRGLLPLRPVGLLTLPSDVRAARRLADSLGPDDVFQGDPRGTRRTLSDLLVFGLGAARPSVVKHPRTARATTSLSRECDAVRRLGRDERLGSWRRLLPVVEECRLDGPLPLVVESRLPGIEADVLLRRFPHLAGPVARSALGTIRELHRATGYAEEATDRVGDWIDPRLTVLGDEVRWCRRDEGAQALKALRAHLERDLVGRRLLVGWTHGDFHPGNVLTQGHGPLCGVIDWAGAVADGPSVLDCYTFVLTLRHQRGRRQFGRVVADVVRSGALRPEDQRLLAGARALVSDPRGQVAITLLTWLWHASGNLEKSARYGRSHRWVADNIVPVLREVAAQETA
ncbi:aminoglycoside phosphotransferase family protein [Streptomyces sp. UG1]|uniref:aminoglycoside phosphotransferase family protein n=1 Tax=Streptomyces sp. UG1 TaxID=3417652 RepID=UPI003CE91964